MSGPPRLGLAALAGVFLADQGVKWLVTRPLGIAEEGDVHTLAPIFDLRFTANRGVSLGLLHASTDAMRWALVALTGAIALGVLVWLWRERVRVDQVALGAIAGGALGNILDRVRLGYVTDFADLHFGEWRPFLVFNVADAAITLGVLVLLARALLLRDGARPTGPGTENVNA